MMEKISAGEYVAQQQALGASPEAICESVKLLFPTKAATVRKRRQRERERDIGVTNAGQKRDKSVTKGVTCHAAPTPPIYNTNNNISNIGSYKKDNYIPQNASTEPEWFAAFWAVYPRRVGRLEAVRAARSIKIAEVPALMAGTKAYAADRAGQDEKFTKHASSWIRARRWAEAADPPTASIPDGTVPKGVVLKYRPL